MSPAIVPVDASYHLGAGSSLVLVFALMGGLVAFWIDARLRARRERQRARRAQESAARSGELAPGAAIVFGAAEIARDETVAARVEIDQSGTESESSGKWSFAWREQDRRVTMRPFYVRVSPKQRVRVEPGDRAFLVDAMDGLILVSLTRRTRYAEISPGEEVYAVGQLARAHDPEEVTGGYRGAATGWVMRAERGEDLLLSSEPLEKRFLRRASAQALISWIAVLLLAVAGALFSAYFAALFTGEDVIGAVVDKGSTADGEGSRSYYLDVRVPHGETLRLDATSESHERVTKGSQVRVRYVPRWLWATDLGDGATAGQVAFLLLGLLGLMAAVRRAITQKHLAWYERALVDADSGTLEENTHATRM